MFSTGKLPLPLGNSALETKARNLSLLARVLVLGAPELPQETTVRLAAASTKTPTKILFKPGTPKSMRDRDLDARKRIITERVRRFSAAGGASLREWLNSIRKRAKRAII